MNRSVIAVAFVAVLCCVSGPASAAQLSTGTVVMTTTGGPSSITLDVSIADNGALAGCTWFSIVRNGAPVAFYPRQVGVQNTLSFIDTNVQPGHVYWYELKASAFPVPVSTPACDEYEFRFAFGSGWGLPIDVPGHVGADPIVLAHGTLVTDQQYWPYVHLEPCNPVAYPWYFEFGGLPSGYEQYIGQDVLMYGDYGGWDIQFGWYPQVTSFEPMPCVPVATKNVTWGHVKSLYR